MKTLKFRDVENIVARHIDISKVNNDTRQREVVVPRQVMHYFAHRYTNKGLREIGKRYGNRSHCTVLHSIKVVRERREVYPEYNKAMQVIDADIYEAVNYNPAMLTEQWILSIPQY